MNINRSDFPLLVSLDILLEERNVTKAAKRLNVSQPALSTQLSKLRDIFDDRLLVPSDNGRGMVPTERGLEIQERLRVSLDGLKDALQHQNYFDPKTSKRKFVIAANDSVFTILGLTVMAEVLNQNNYNLQMSVIPPYEQYLNERMAQGEIDLYIGDMNKMPESLKMRYLMKDRFLMAQRKEHPRGISKPSLADYCKLSHVVVSQKADFVTSIDHILASLTCQRNVVVSVSSYNQVALVLSNSDCVTTLPSQLLNRYESSLDLIDVPFEIPAFELAMAWHPRVHEDASNVWLRKQFIKAIS
ncbi:LysR family transcriptional regulator [Methylotenera sp.]|uniref:LysR family transcriptional regulator n=1 Tax=Methylotenera sp. TaxID=2051956 RepID=UPI0024873E74|nr:LysR family transcriptional regulator [Methylotenera sp.]MDI1361758.1 LysR family transcriptional regulator [Methylotenera sp.]